jgi:SAM-dependent methyltransferase
MSGTVYSLSDYATVDIGAQMRIGHPYIAEGDRIIVDIVRELARSKERPLRTLEIGSGSGYLTELLMRAIPQANFIANEVEPALVALARQRFLHSPVELFDRSFEDWTEPVDVVISWGSYHHMSSRTYLAHAARLLGPEGVLILGDEFCPDFLRDADQRRLRDADLIFLANGYLLTTNEEVAAFCERGIIPEWSRKLERSRKQALWTWYKYVIDVAMHRNDSVVIQAELQIAADDLRTEFEGEHKLPLAVALRHLDLNGFVEVSRVALETKPEIASFFIIVLKTVADVELGRATNAS